MTRTITLVATMLAASCASWVNAAELCSLLPKQYDTAMTKFPQIAFALHELKKFSIASWYSDNISNGDYTELVTNLVNTCPSSSIINLVVYGLPNKDCDAGYSNHGTNKSPQDYARFIQSLADIVGQRKILYVLEPDAVGLAAKEGGCGQQSGYKEYIAKAIGILSSNPNAEIYLDVGYWTLTSPETAGALASVVRQLSQAGRVKGITLNTSNYRSNDELARLCGNFQTAMGSDSMHCIIDSSRNYNGAPPGNEWCNARSGGIGKPPTSDTGYPNIDYLIWIKPPGESDGTCDASDRTTDAMKGPPAGVFFSDGLASLWNNGYFVKELHMSPIDGTVRAMPTKAPLTTAPSTTMPPITESSTAAPLMTEPPTTLPVTNDTIITEEPVVSANPTVEPKVVETPTPSTPVESEKHEANVKSSGHAKLTAGYIVLMVVVASAVAIVVALVVVKIKQKQRFIAQLKTPSSERLDSVSRVSPVIVKRMSYSSL